MMYSISQYIIGDKREAEMILRERVKEPPIAIEIL